MRAQGRSSAEREARELAFQTPDAYAMNCYRKRLAVKFKPGEHFKNVDVQRAVWPQLPVMGWIGIHREHLAIIIDTMEDAGLLVPSFGPRGGEGWALTEQAECA